MNVASKVLNICPCRKARKIFHLHVPLTCITFGHYFNWLPAKVILFSSFGLKNFEVELLK